MAPPEYLQVEAGEELEEVSGVAHVAVEHDQCGGGVECAKFLNQLGVVLERVNPAVLVRA